jgi:hypothetical protein
METHHSVPLRHTVVKHRSPTRFILSEQLEMKRSSDDFGHAQVGSSQARTSLHAKHIEHVLWAT